MPQHTLNSVHFSNSGKAVVTKLNFDQGQSDMYLCPNITTASSCQSDDANCSPCEMMNGWIYSDLKNKVSGSNMCNK